MQQFKLYCGNLLCDKESDIVSHEYAVYKVCQMSRQRYWYNYVGFSDDYMKTLHDRGIDYSGYYGTRAEIRQFDMASRAKKESKSKPPAKSNTKSKTKPKQHPTTMKMDIDEVEAKVQPCNLPPPFPYFQGNMQMQNDVDSSSNVCNHLFVFV